MTCETLINVISHNHQTPVVSGLVVAGERLVKIRRGKRSFHTRSRISDGGLRSAVGVLRRHKTRDHATDTPKFCSQNQYSTPQTKAGDECGGGDRSCSSERGTRKEGDLSSREMCRRIFLNMMASEEFMVLRELTVSNFGGIKKEKLNDCELIDKRVTEGAYDWNSDLFASDIDQV